MSKRREGQQHNRPPEATLFSHADEIFSLGKTLSLSLNSHRNQIPPDLQGLINKALAEKGAGEYETIDEFLGDLEKAKASMETADVELPGIEYKAEEVFRKITTVNAYILGAKMIDELGIGKQDNVLCIGPGIEDTHPVACAIKGAIVDIVQPELDKRYNPPDPQMDTLRRYIEHRRGLIIKRHERDLIGNRIDTESYEGLIEEVNVPAGHYSYVFLLNVLERLVSDSQSRFIEKVFSCLTDKSCILFSGFPGVYEEMGLSLLKTRAQRLGYEIIEKRVFPGQFAPVYELIVIRNKSTPYLQKSPANQAL